MSFTLPKTRTLLWRGLRKKCPQCGEGPLYKGWIKLHEHCPVCGLRYLPDQGDLWGPLLLLDRLLFIIPMVVLFYFGVVKPNWIFLVVFGGGMTLLLVLTAPNRNGASLALDYLIRRKAGDLSDENSPGQ